MNFVNLTPHAITVRTPDGDKVFSPSGTVARVGSMPGALLDTIDGVPCYSAPVWGDVTGLPDPADGVAYIVSGLVASRVSRPDVYSPATGPTDGAIRDDRGQIIAVTRLIRSC